MFTARFAFPTEYQPLNGQATCSVSVKRGLLKTPVIDN